MEHNPEKFSNYILTFNDRTFKINDDSFIY